MIMKDKFYSDSDIFKKRINFLKWSVPLSFVIITVVYQLVIANWVQENFGHLYHLGIELGFYGTVGPIVSLWVIQLLEKWYEEKAQAENIARRTERRFASVAAASADAIISVDQKGDIESWNRGATMIFGNSEEEMLSLPFVSLYSDQNTAASEYKWLSDTIIKDGWIRGFETNKINLDENQKIFELTGTHLVNDNNESRGISFILRDITDRKNREKEIQMLNETLNFQVLDRTQELADKMGELNIANSELLKLDKTRSEFISLVSHQIRAPLTNMQGAVERIQLDCHDRNDTCIRMHSILEQQIIRLDSLVKDVLNVSQIEFGKILVDLEPVSVYPIIHKVIDQFQARTTSRTFHITEKPGMPLVHADRNRVAEILSNLVDNAGKYSPKSNDISIEVKSNQTELVISVIDSGIGIPLEDQTRVFDKFYRSDSTDSQSSYGYGLGLYVCRLLVEAQGGKIWVENLSEKGSVFSFSLPVWRE